MQAECPYGDVVEVPRHLRTRLLYANPVCFLSTAGPPLADGRPRINVMTISWVMPLNNDGKVVLSMNCRRYSASLLAASRRLVLSVPVAGSEAALLLTGGCHGTDDQPKYDREDVRDAVGPLCAPGWGEWAQEADEDGRWKVPAVAAAVAHLEVEIEEMPEATHGHYLLQGHVAGAWVRQAYWQQGKLFAPAAGMPPYMSFLGTKTFAYVATAP